MVSASSIALVFIIVSFTIAGAPGYGAALWEALAGGLTRREQEEHLRRVAAPSFESSLVLLLVLIFGGGALYPGALHAMGTSLSATTAVMVAAILVRALSLTVHSRLLSLLSLAAPVCMGLIVGVFSSGALTRGEVSGEPPLLWPVLVGALTLSVFAWLSAVRVCEASAPDDPDAGGRAVHAFRSRALLSFFTVTVLSLSLVFFAWTHAAGVYHQLISGPFSFALQFSIAALSIAALHTLIRERWAWAFRFAAMQSALIVAGGMVAAQAAAPAIFPR